MRLIYGSTALLLKWQITETVSTVDIKITLFSIVAVMCELWAFTLHIDNEILQSNSTVCSVLI
jgi:hypothetical protein